METLALGCEICVLLRLLMQSGWVEGATQAGQAQLVAEGGYWKAVLWQPVAAGR